MNHFGLAPQQAVILSATIYNTLIQIKPQLSFEEILHGNGRNARKLIKWCFARYGAC
jgi:UV DNA damage repair endonuclease